MKKFIISLIFLNISIANATIGVRAKDAITVQDGKVIETGILTDDSGRIFFEFLRGSFINYTKDKQPFSGEILQPAIIPKKEKLPRGRMREILTFELLTDNTDEVTLTDRFTLMHSKEYLRETLANPDGLVHGEGGIKFLTRIYDKDKIGFPSLWIQKTRNVKNKIDKIKYWKKIGGKLNKNAESDVQVFTAVINKTGVYGLFDEDPNPFYSENTPLETVQKIEESPYPSVITKEPIPECLVKKEEDIFNKNDFSLKDEPIEIPAVKIGTKTNIKNNDETLIIPAIKVKNIESIETTQKDLLKNNNSINTNKNQMHVSLNPNDIEMLPVAGSDITSPNISSKFPIILIISFLIFGFSIYLAIKKDY
jgi:hypothetical protein